MIVESNNRGQTTFSLKQNNGFLLIDSKSTMEISI